MAQGITFDITARVTGYERSLQQLRNELTKLNPGSEIAKNITQALQVAEGKVKALSHNLTPKVTNDSQLDRLVGKVNEAGDSILKVSGLMQNIKPEDINLAAIGNGFEQLQQKVQALESELQGKLNQGLKDFINNSSGLQKAFAEFNIDPSKMTTGQIFDTLIKKADEAATQTEAAGKRVLQAQKELTNKENSLNQLQKNPIYNRATLESELNAMSADYVKAITNIKEQVASGLSSFNFGNGSQHNILNAFFDGLSKENLASKVQELINNVKAELQKGGKTLSNNEILKSLFPDTDVGGSKSGYNIELILNKLFPNMTELKAAWQEKLQSFSKELKSPTKVGEIQTLISKGEIDAALATTLKYLESAYKTIQGREIQLKQDVANAQSNLTSQQGAYNAAQQDQAKVSNIQTALQGKVTQLERDNVTLRNEIATLRKQIEGMISGQLSGTKGGAAGAGNSAAAFKVANGEVQKYNHELDKAAKAEQMLGKVQGILTRWFSIYTVVRTVNKAVRDVINTIKELDKTITNIAIVTDMTHQELWGQMNQYTAIAREYGASISGVYEVSQLYYQQGLQTADVLKLTTATLKMARISGLDYGEATNFMTNALRSFKMENEEANRVVDTYSALAASAAISVSELAEAMSKTASSAYAVGSSIEATSAMITVMVEATRESSSNIGSAMKSIISRYGEMTSDPSKIVDSEGEEMSLNRVDKALQTIGISIHDAQGQFRNFDEVIMELASKWSTLDTNAQRYYKVA